VFSPRDLTLRAIEKVPRRDLLIFVVDSFRCERFHQPTSVHKIYAAGDIARFYSPIFKRYLRVELVDVAQRQGATAGANMTGRKKAFDELSYFFSNQFDLEINAYGDLSQHTTVVRRGRLDAKRGFIQFYLDGPTLNGILCVNADWNEVERAKTLILMRKDFAHPSILSDESKTLKSMIKKAGPHSRR
jgi:3-phenylpropionate/trans-cinnamate dioxygenase ferredoxin reductase subunit